MQYQKPYTLLYCFILLLLLTGIKVKAQNVSLPYSALGIGEVETEDYGRYFASGSTSIARRDEFSYNFANPASLTALPYKRMNFDMAMRGTVNFFQLPGTDTVTGVSKDFAIERITMAFKVSKNTGIAFGLRPYSSVSYQYQLQQAIITGSTNEYDLVDGTGGINQVYFSAGQQISKHFSIGLTPSYLFGSLQKTSVFYSDNEPYVYSFTKSEITTLYGANLQGGIQYDSYSPPTKDHPTERKWEHQLGLTATVSSQLNGQLTTAYFNTVNPKDTIYIGGQPQLVTNASFKLPTTIGFGYSASNNKKDSKLSLSFDVNYSNWPYQSVQSDGNGDSYTSSTLRVSAGIEYSKKRILQGYEFEKYFLAAGVSGENSYIMVDGNYLKNYSFSFGGGFNVLQKLSVYGGIELGVKGSLGDNQIKESYSNFVLGLTFKDLWYGTKKFGKFY